MVLFSAEGNTTPKMKASGYSGNLNCTVQISPAENGSVLLYANMDDACVYFMTSWKIPNAVTVWKTNHNPTGEQKLVFTDGARWLTPKEKTVLERYKHQVQEGSWSATYSAHFQEL